MDYLQYPLIFLSSITEAWNVVLNLIINGLPSIPFILELDIVAKSKF